MPSCNLQCHVQVATLIKDHSPEEVDEAFGIEGELTEEELNNVYTDCPWLKE